MRLLLPILPLTVLAAVLVTTGCGACEIFRVATYNLEGYLDTSTQTRREKSEPSKAKIRESIRAMKPDVLAIQELGAVSTLLELRDSLKIDGVDLPYWEHVTGSDTNIHVGVLSRFPFIARHPYTNEHYLLDGRRFHVSRGFAELEIQAAPNYSFTLICAHLKSKRTAPQADEAEMRAQEAALLREKIDAHLAANPDANLIILGDFNDTKDSPSTKILVGRGKHKLVDTRPAEQTDYDSNDASLTSETRKVTWTLYYAKDDTFSRVDYILLSPGMAREWIPKDTFVATVPGWGIGSDHRPLVAGFEAEDK